MLYRERGIEQSSTELNIDPKKKKKFPSLQRFNFILIAALIVLKSQPHPFFALFTNLAIIMIYIWQFGYLLCFDLGILVRFLSPSLYALPFEFLYIYLIFFSLFKVYLQLWALFLRFFIYFLYKEWIGGFK